MCFSIKVMNFKIVILTCVINQTPCYLIYTHFLNILWKNFIKCDPLQKMYVWLKYSTSLWTLRWPLRRWGNMTCFIQLDIMNSREMTKCGQKLNKKISFTVTVLLCQLFCRDTTCSHSSSDKHTAAWWIYWSFLEYKLTEKNNKSQFVCFLLDSASER